MNRVNQEYITYLSGNVRIFYGDIEFKSDLADIYEKRQHVVLRGNVIVVQDSLMITCEDAQYFHENQLLQVQQNVVITELLEEGIYRRSTSSSGTHFRESGEFFLRGNVFIQDFKEHLFARAGYLTFNQQTGYGYMIESPVVWRAAEDSLALFAEKIEYFEENNKVLASFGVITQNVDIKVTSDFLIYYGDEDRIVYIGDPKFYSENGDGEADLITVLLENNEIREILMEGNCYIRFSSDDSGEKNSWVRSDYMTLFYINDRAEEFIARENVSSFLRQGGERRSRMDNNVTGELLNILFDENSNIIQLIITDSVSGKYRFNR
jgi:lipopolysaccharide export system protein LptA